MFSFKSCKTARLITLVCYQVWGFEGVLKFEDTPTQLKTQLSEGGGEMPPP